MIGLSEVDRTIGLEVGRLIWYLLPDMHPAIERAQEDPRFVELWTHSPDRDAQQRDILVDHPVIYLGSERFFGTTDRGFEYPGVSGQSLPLSEYMSKLRLFLIYRLTRPPEGSLQLLMAAVRDVAECHGWPAAMDFVVKLWRGRWLCDCVEIGFLIKAILTEGTEAGIDRLVGDRTMVIERVNQIIAREREAKERARSTEEWLFEAYCLLPEIFAWFGILSDMRERKEDDELSKYSRVLDEFLADISTTLAIPLMQRAGGEGLAEIYALKPVDAASSVSDARRAIRGTYRGRSIIPKVWYEQVSTALDRVDTEGLPLRSSSFSQKEVENLDRVDIALIFGCAFTKDGKDSHWMTTAALFDLYETTETPPDALSGISISRKDPS